MPISPGNSRTIAQEVGEKWTGEAVLQPTFLKSDRLLESSVFCTCSFACSFTRSPLSAFRIESPPILWIPPITTRL
ncbi:hypothetical protein, partial [Thiomonas sp.]